MTAQEMKQLLYAEIESKKAYTNSYELACNVGKHTMTQGQSYVFIGNKRCCNDCQAEIMEWLEE